MLSYVAALKDLELLMEAVEIVKHMMETPGDNKDKLFQLLAGTVWLIFFVLLPYKVSLCSRPLATGTHLVQS